MSFLCLVAERFQAVGVSNRNVAFPLLDLSLQIVNLGDEFLDGLPRHLVFVAHPRNLYALGRSMQLLTSGDELVKVDQTILVAVNQHKESPNILGGDVHGFQEAGHLAGLQCSFQLLHAHHARIVSIDFIEHVAQGCRLCCLLLHLTHHHDLFVRGGRLNGRVAKHPSNHIEYREYGKNYIQEQACHRQCRHLPQGLQRLDPRDPARDGHVERQNALRNAGPIHLELRGAARHRVVVAQQVHRLLAAEVRDDLGQNDAEAVED
mmetsp:Transcript_54256/g.86302  ORF Transcript_54256/g.86302 Transcript_54256/m.86302 type:complete len:263 (-) Transcript_54256:798-1586(-)